jgi:hypothetical protein
LLIPAVGLGLFTAAAPSVAAAPAVAGSSYPVPERAVATSRVVERVEIGILGSAKPIVVKKRTLRGSRAVAGRRFSVDTRTASIQSSAEACYYAKPSWRRYNGFRKLASKAWYYIEWCGRNGRVTKVLTLFCGGVGAQGFGYDGCSVRRGATGYSRLNVSGSWRFPFRVGPYTLLGRTITVSARHYPNGRYAGTWWRYQ